MAFRASQTALKTALRASRARPTQLALQQPRTLPALQGVRWTTGQVSGQPGSKDFKEWRENAKVSKCPTTGRADT